MTAKQSAYVQVNTPRRQHHRTLSQWGYLAGVGMTVLCIFALWTRNLDGDSLWFDEGWSAHAAGQPSVIDAANADATNPPLYYSLLYLHAQAFGLTEFSLRLFSSFAGLLTVCLCGYAARRLWGRSAGLLAVILVSCLPLMGWAAREARMYTLLAALVVVAAAAWQRIYATSKAGSRPSRGVWVALWGAQLALLYAHNSGPVVVLWLNAITGLAWVTGRTIQHPPWRIWIAGQVGVGVLYTPYFVTRFVLLGSANAAVTTSPLLTPAFAFDLWRSLWVTPYERVLLSGDGLQLTGVLLIVCAAVWGAGLAARRGGWWLIHALLLTGGLLAALTVLQNEMHSRYLVMIAPLPLIGLAGALTTLRPSRAAWAFMAGVIGVAGWNTISVQETAFRHDDARGMVAYYAEHLTAADSVIAWSYADRYDLAYYWDRLDVTAQRITLPEGADYGQIAPLLPTTGRVALNVWYTQRADYRGMLSCVLGHGTTALPVEFTTYGMTTRVYDESALTRLTMPDAARTPAITFARLDSGIVADVYAPDVGQIDFTADRALCLPLALTLREMPGVDLSAVVQVRDAAGRVVASANAVFATPDQRTTRHLVAGDSATAFPLVRLPYGAAPGTYTVFIRVYDDAAYASGYVPQMEGVTGRDAPLGRWQVMPGANWPATGRLVDLPHRVDLPVGDRRLIAHDAPVDGVLQNGGGTPVTLIWEGDGRLPELTVRDADGRWSSPLTTTLTAAPDGVVRDVRTVRIPGDAEAGSASLTLPDGTILGRWTVEVVPFTTAVPPAMTPLTPPVVFPGSGDLIGWLYDDADPIRVTLVWRAAEVAAGLPEGGHTVFVQFLAADGHVIAQSDSPPAGGTRPMTGWRPGEVIVDTHVVRPHEGISIAALRSATLIAGLYDPLTGQRTAPAVSSTSSPLDYTLLR